MRKIKNYSKSGILLLILTAMIISCQKSDIDFRKLSNHMEFSGRVAAPVIFGNLSLQDVLDRIGQEDNVKLYDDSLLYVVFTDTLYRGGMNDIVDPIPDQDFIEEYIEADIVNDEWINSNVGDTVRFHKVKDTEWTFENNERVDSIHVKTLDLVIDVSSTFKHTGILHITSPDLTVNGEPFTHDVMISDVTGTFVYNQTVDLSGHNLYLKNDIPGTTYLPLNFDLDLINSGNPVLPGEVCHITMQFTNMEVFAVFGYAGDQDEQIENDVVTFDFFTNNEIDGDLFVEDPQFYIYITNSFGVPFDIDLSGLSTYSQTKDITTLFTLDDNPYRVDAPVIDSVGTSKRTVIGITNDNSNISEVISSLPSRLDYSVRAVTNPDGLVFDNFVTDSSELEVQFEAIVPLYIRASGFTLQDTLEFELGDEADYIEYLRLSLDVVNGLPLNVNIQAYFVDENYNQLDSMFVDDAFIIAPSLNAEDKVEDPNVYTKSVEFTLDKIERIKPTRFILMNAKVSTAEASNGKSAKFYSYYDIGFKLKMTTDLKYESWNN